MQVLQTETAQYPLVSVGGTAAERGRSYGQQAKDRIHHTLDAYSQLFSAYADLDWPEVTRYALRYQAIIEAYDPELSEEMDGIAHGAAVGFEDILAINVRTEVMYGLGELRAAADCTAFAALPSATGNAHTLIGQNWDWHPSAFESCIILAARQVGRPSILTVVEAGLLAKMGMNSQGVGLATNAMVSSVDQGDPGIPYHVMLRSILNSSDLDEATNTVREAHRASSANYLIASNEGRAVDLEAGPGGRDRVFAIEPDGGVIGHANCFVAPGVTVEDETTRKRPLSKIRQHTMDDHLASHSGSITGDLMMSVLSEHEHQPNSMCRHPLPDVDPIDRSATVASIVMDLDEVKVWVADGQPCCHQYRELSPEDIWSTAS